MFSKKVQNLYTLRFLAHFSALIPSLNPYNYAITLSIKDLDSLKDIASNESWVPADQLNPSGYGGLFFECGCGEKHILATTPYVMCATPVKFLTQCDNGITTLVRVKGIFSKTCHSEWFCKSILMGRFRFMGKLDEPLGKF